MRSCWICLMALLFITQSSSGIQKQSADSSAGQRPDLSISISAPQSTIKISGDIIVEVTITNTSAQALFAPDLAFDLRDPSGKPVPRTQRKSRVPPGGSFVSIPLKPGQSVVSKINLKKQFVIAMPGQYTLQAWREEYVRGTNKVRGRIRSNTIVFHVVG